jgi:osmotically inducible lipoprotein OsmB
MKTMQRMAVSTVAAVVLLGSAGCGGMSTRDKYTVGGAVAGGVAGSVLGGGTVGTVGGAVVGGVIGNQVAKDKK